MSAPRDKKAPGDKPIGVGVLGLGLMGRTHVEALQRARRDGWPVRLVAACDANQARLDGKRPSGGNVVRGGFGQLFDPRLVRTSTDPSDVFGDPEVQLVIVCTHTESHVPLSLAALQAGKHVLCEKPLALQASKVRPLLGRRRTPLFMPGLCMRAWPGWSWLKQRIQDRTLGRVTSAVFRRLASRPSWAPAFYGDSKKSGGALIDLHIHDADFVRHCFGMPQRVTTTGSLDHLTTLYHFERGPQHVVAEGGWDHDAAWPFQMSYTAVFEHGTAEYDLRRDPKLVLYREGRAEAVALDALTGYDLELRQMLAAIQSGAASKLIARAEDGYQVARLLEVERRSLESKKTVGMRA